MWNFLPELKMNPSQFYLSSFFSYLSSEQYIFPFYKGGLTGGLWTSNFDLFLSSCERNNVVSILESRHPLQRSVHAVLKILLLLGTRYKTRLTVWRVRCFWATKCNRSDCFYQLNLFVSGASGSRAISAKVSAIFIYHGFDYLK